MEYMGKVRSCYGKPYSKKINGEYREQYDRTKSEKVLRSVDHLIVSITSEEAGHKYHAVDIPTTIELSKKQHRLCKRLEAHSVSNKYNIIADTPSKLLQKLHQISGGFVKTEDGLYTFKQNPKIQWIKENYNP